MDLSSEMIHSLLPVYLVSVLGAGAISLGLIEGVGEATAAVVKLFSGALSDRCGRRKPLVLAGYGLAALTKPLFPLAQGVGTVLLARLLDRVGKGLRGAPRDALVADLTPPAQRGAAFGLRQALDTLGAVLGPLAAVALMAATDDVRAVFWIASLPAAVAVAVLVLGVREPAAAAATPAPPRPPLAPGRLDRLGTPFWRLIGFAGLAALGRFSGAFLLLRGQDAGLPVALVPLILVTMNLAEAAVVYPVGRLSDRIGRHGLLAGGFAALILADLVLAGADQLWLVFAGASLWGLHIGATQGLLTAMIADAVPADCRGTAFGVFNMVTGASLLTASIVAGLLWTLAGPGATFLGGAIAAGLALALLPRLCR